MASKETGKVDEKAASPKDGDKTNIDGDKSKSSLPLDSGRKNGSKSCLDSTKKNGDVKSNASLQVGGAKLKMPSGQMTLVTKAQKRIVELQGARNVRRVILEAVIKFEKELQQLLHDCENVNALNAAQEEAKKRWLDKHEVSQKVEYLKKLKQIWNVPMEVPLVTINDKASQLNDDNSAVSSRRSRFSAAALAAAEEAALQCEHQRLQKRREQQAKERQLRQKRLQMEEEEQKLKEQMEQDDLEARLEQARRRREVLEDAASEVLSEKFSASVIRRPQDRELENLPTMHQPTDWWLEQEHQKRVDGMQRAEPEEERHRNVHADQDWAEPNHNYENPLHHLLLPRLTLNVFSGDPTEYMWFSRAFKLQVEDVTQDPARRLHLLLQHLQGEPRDLVIGCQLASNPVVGYQRAKAKLNQEYGNPVRQAIVFKQRLLEWKQLGKDPKDIKEFATQLQLCEEVKANYRMPELDASSTLLQLMNKLPFKLQEAWQRRVCRLEAQNLAEASFKDFVRFVKEQSDAVNHPIYGKHTSQPENKNKAKTMLTNTGDCGAENGKGLPQSGGEHVDTKEAKKDATKPPCLLCAGQHPTLTCLNSQSIPLQERREKLRGLCFGCLKPGHAVKYCKVKESCQLCQRRHPTVLHDVSKESKGNTATAETEKKQVTPSEATRKTETSCLTTCSAKVAISIVPVKVWFKSEAHSVIIRAVLDNASTSTFITSSVIERLNIPTKGAPLQLSTMNGTSNDKTSVAYGISVSDLDGNDPLTLGPTYVVPSMPLSLADVPGKELISKWPHLNSVPFEWRAADAPIEMLIGNNDSEALMPKKIIASEVEHEPYAVKTRLGWTLNGPLGKNRQDRALVNLIATRGEDNIQEALHRLHYNDFQDAYNFRSRGPSQDDKEWLRRAQETIKRTPEGQYQIDLPFRVTDRDQHLPPETVLANNREQAMRRLHALESRFAASPKFKSDYVAFMKKMEDSGYIERVSTLDDEGGRQASYIPHHGVYHPRKGKLRIVFNCSSKYKGVALNDCLKQGPDLTSTLVGVLIRFRQERIAFMADIESMFYRVLVPKEQRDALRYLWWPEGDTSQPVQTYRMKVHLFGATSSPSCANFALRQAANDALAANAITEDVKKSVHSNFYVDDCLKSMPDVQTATHMAKGLIKACEYGGFKLTKFIATSPQLLHELDVDALAPQLQEINFNNEKADPLGALAERALGVAWNIGKDKFYFKSSEEKKLEIAQVTNKRKILSILSTVYDPLGFVAPFVIRARMLFRNLTKGNIGWDEDLGSNHSDAESLWKAWLLELKHLKDVMIPRCYRSPTSRHHNDWQLHVFSDASLEAYAAVAYLRQANSDGSSAQVSFVFGKARVSPPKVVTVPRLELTAAKLATDIACLIRKELDPTFNITQRFFWTDSQTVLKYLSNTSKRFHTFVANRVCSILETTDICEWHFVPTDANPADEGTRGRRAEEMQLSKWLNGPSFLKDGPETWPVGYMNTQIAADDPEVKTMMTVQDKNEKQVPWVDEWASHHSSMHRLRKSAAVWLKFKHLMRHKSLDVTRILVPDLARAEKALIIWLQRETWPTEYAKLLGEEQVVQSSPLFKLSPKLVNGVISMDSRTRDLLPILPKGHLSRLLVCEAHAFQLHMGRQSTAAAVQRKYWIIGLKQMVRKELQRCAACQLRHAKPRPPPMAPLPEFRREQHGNKAFEISGVDYFGPIPIDRGATQASSKAYGVIFTCAVTRGVHLEVAESLSTDGFLNAFRRFVARRGHCKTIVSDQGTNFKGADETLKKELHQELDKINCDEVQSHLRRKGIEWLFNAPHASHHGGFWERLIRTIRRCLQATITKPLCQDTLHTLLCEIESVLNSRPLTSVSEDTRDLEALTPNHLIMGAAGAPQLPNADRRSSSKLKKQWRLVQHLANTFWKRWVKEYRVLLHERTKWHRQLKRQLEVDDVVLVVDDLQPRNQWKLGRIVSVCPNHNSDDLQPRVVNVVTKQGLFQRPVTKLCLLETASQK